MSDDHVLDGLEALEEIRNRRLPQCACKVHRLTPYLPAVIFSDFIHTAEKCAVFSMLGFDVGRSHGAEGKPVLTIHWSGYPGGCSYVVGGGS